MTLVSKNRHLLVSDEEKNRIKELPYGAPFSNLKPGFRIQVTGHMEIAVTEVKKDFLTLEIIPTSGDKETICIPNRTRIRCSDEFDLEYKVIDRPGGFGGELVVWHERRFDENHDKFTYIQQPA